MDLIHITFSDSRVSSGWLAEAPCVARRAICRYPRYMDARGTPERPADEALYVSAAEAARMLGVAVTSLYAYVGRKGIRSQPVAGTRKRLYWREDIEKVSRRGTIQRDVSPDSILVPETKITLLTDKGPFYRGHSAIALAERASLEEAAALIWRQPLDIVFPSETLSAPPTLAAARHGLRGLSPREQAGGLFPLLEGQSPRSFDRSDRGFARTGGELMRWFAALTADAPEPTSEPIHTVLARAWRASPDLEDLIRCALVLLVDHELTADTYAVRAVANTGCTAHQAIIVGMVATAGRRIEQGRTSAIRRLIEEIMAAPDPTRPIINLCRSGETVPGFEARKGGTVDQRARLLLRRLEQSMGDDHDVGQLLRAVKTAQETIDLDANFALTVLFLEWKLGVPARDFALKITARIAGWIAHAFEQMDTRPMVRPHAAYTGTLPIGT